MNYLGICILLYYCRLLLDDRTDCSTICKQMGGGGGGAMQRDVSIFSKGRFHFEKGTDRP